MIGKHFYNRTVKRAVIAFGTLFNNIVIQRNYKSGRTKIVPVQVAYGPREKWVELSKKKSQQFLQTLPKITFESTTLNYDINRKLLSSNKLRQMRTTEDGTVVDTNLMPTPYNLNFTMFIQSKTLDDGWQIIEQITPFFTPGYTLKVKDSSSIENEINMPITLTSVTWTDDYQGGPSDARLIEFSLEFDAKVNFYGPATKGSSIILKTDTTVSSVSDQENEAVIDLSSIDRVFNADGTFGNQFTYDKGPQDRRTGETDAAGHRYSAIQRFGENGFLYSTTATYPSGTFIMHEGIIYKAEQDIPIDREPGQVGADVWRPYSIPAIASERTVITGAEGASENPTEPTIQVLSGQGLSSPSPLPIITLGVDNVPPNLIAWGLDVDTGSITLRFDEEIFTSRSMLTNITLHGPGGAYTLRSSSIVTPQNNTNTLNVNLGSDTADVRAIIPVTTAPSQVAISATEGYVQDLFGNEALAIPIPTADVNGVFPPNTNPFSISGGSNTDIIGPVITSFILNLEDKTLAINFNEDILTNNFSWNAPINLGGYDLDPNEPTTSFAFSAVGNRTLTFEFTDTIRDEIDNALGNPVGITSTVAYDFPANLVQDVTGGNFNTQMNGTGILILFDRLVPAVTGWSLNLSNITQTDTSLNITIPANSIQVRFENEPFGAVISTITPSRFTISGIGTFDTATDTTITSTTLTGSTVIPETANATSDRVVNIELTQDVLDLVERVTQNGLLPITLSGTMDYARDRNNNIPGPFGVGQSRPALSPTLIYQDPDTTGPQLISFDTFDVSLAGNTISFTFSSDADMKTFDPSKVSFTSSNIILSNPNFVTDDTLNTVTYTLDTLQNTQLRFASNNTRNEATLNLAEGAVQDDTGNLSTPSTGVITSTLNGFTQGPSISVPTFVSGSIDLQSNQITLSFSKMIDTTLFNYMTLNIQRDLLTSTSIDITSSDLAGPVIFNQGNTIILDLTQSIGTQLENLLGGVPFARIDIPGNFITDVDGNAFLEAINEPITVVSRDTTAPEITSWSLNLMDTPSTADATFGSAHTLRLFFGNEPVGVIVSTLDTSKLFIQGVGTGYGTNGTVSLASATVITSGTSNEIDLDISDTVLLDTIEKITYNGRLPLFLFGEADFVTDRASNNGTAFGGPGSFVAGSVLSLDVRRDNDITRPNASALSNWTLDLDSGLITLLFENEVDLDTIIDITKISVGRASFSTPLTTQSAFSSFGNTITITLSAIDQNNLIASTGNSAVLSPSTGSFISFEEEAFLDQVGNPNTTLTNIAHDDTGVDFTPSATPQDPDLELVIIDFSTGVMALQFSTSIIPATVNLSALQFSTLVNTRVNSGTHGLTSTNTDILNTSPSNIIRIQLNRDDDFLLGLMTYNANNIISSNTTVSAGPGLGLDGSNNATRPVSGLAVIFFGQDNDTTRPSLTPSPSEALIVDLSNTTVDIEFDEGIQHNDIALTDTLFNATDFTVTGRSGLTHTFTSDSSVIVDPNSTGTQPGAGSILRIISGGGNSTFLGNAIARAALPIGFTETFAANYQEGSFENLPGETQIEIVVPGADTLAGQVQAVADFYAFLTRINTETQDQVFPGDRGIPPLVAGVAGRDQVRRLYLSDNPEISLKLIFINQGRTTESTIRLYYMDFGTTTFPVVPRGRHDPVGLDERTLAASGDIEIGKIRTTNTIYLDGIGHNIVIGERLTNAANGVLFNVVFDTEEFDERGEQFTSITFEAPLSIALVDFLSVYRFLPIGNPTSVDGLALLDLFEVQPATTPPTYTGAEGATLTWIPTLQDPVGNPANDSVATIPSASLIIPANTFSTYNTTAPAITADPTSTVSRLSLADINNNAVLDIQFPDGFFTHITDTSPAVRIFTSGTFFGQYNSGPGTRIDVQLGTAALTGEEIAIRLAEIFSDISDGTTGSITETENNTSALSRQCQVYVDGSDLYFITTSATVGVPAGTNFRNFTGTSSTRIDSTVAPMGSTILTSDLPTPIDLGLTRVSSNSVTIANSQVITSFIIDGNNTIIQLADSTSNFDITQDIFYGPYIASPSIITP